MLGFLSENKVISFKIVKSPLKETQDVGNPFQINEIQLGENKVSNASFCCSSIKLKSFLFSCVLSVENHHMYMIHISFNAEFNSLSNDIPEANRMRAIPARKHATEKA